MLSPNPITLVDAISNLTHSFATEVPKDLQPIVLLVIGLLACIFAIFATFACVLVLMITQKYVDFVLTTLTKITDTLTNALNVYLTRPGEPKHFANKDNIPASEANPSEQDSAIAHRNSLFLALAKALDDLLSHVPSDTAQLEKLAFSSGISQILINAITAVDRLEEDASDFSCPDELHDIRIHVRDALSALVAGGRLEGNAAAQGTVSAMRVYVEGVMMISFADDTLRDKLLLVAAEEEKNM
ncbi:hypothetical protein LTS10_005135 [Elasticomyces elasticus]|nr:hypothetical protein LTS10_005135 [Elasticomyces elasticus]